MKKELLLSFFCGTVIPLLIVAGASLRPGGEVAPDPTAPPGPAAADTEAASVPTQPALSDADFDLEVLTQDGETERMDLESYLTGVVLAEMPASFHQEALKAQAVVARTYTCRRMGQQRHETAAVCTDPGCCQAFRSKEDYVAAGGLEEDAEKVLSAVRETAGQVLTYEGALIDATYFSCSGGFTEDAVEVWGQEVPYLRAVESPGEEDAPRFREEQSFSPEQFCALTGVEGRGPVQTWFSEPDRTEGGGVEQMEICGRRFTGQELRRLLGLRSAAFTVEVREGQIVVETRGFGHRVGMSQYGAEAMAREGRLCGEILAHYYQGTQLERLSQYGT